MIKATLYVDTPYQMNKIFDPNDSNLNRDNCLLSYRALRTSLLRSGIELNTQDITAAGHSSFTIYNDIPDVIPEWHSPEQSIALLFESAVVKPNNWSDHMHSLFSCIFTWDDSYIDGIKYRKLNFAQPSLMPCKNEIPFRERSFSALIAGNKSSNHPNESYSDRVNTIKWFEKHHSDKLDLFGLGWEKGVYPSTSRLRRSLARRIPKVAPRAFFPIRTYRGQVQSKFDTLSRYRFAICYENAIGFPGYITEKIFDCFISGVVPVYLGPPNVKSYLPSNTYVDRNSFKTHRELYSYLEGMSENEFLQFRSNIDSFLLSGMANQFTIGFFAESITKAALELIS